MRVFVGFVVGAGGFLRFGWLFGMLVLLLFVSLPSSGWV